jgi:probable rRNA maturation factor
MLDISKTIKSTPPGVPFGRLKEEALGSEYRLSLVFVGDKRSRAMNWRYRSKDKPANVLAFPLERNEGEIIINPRQAHRDAGRFGLSRREMVALLFVHGMLHLKGMKHGGKMEEREKQILRDIK